MISWDRRLDTAKPVTGGKGNKGKGGGQQYDYITNVLIGLGQSSVSGAVVNIWRDKDEFQPLPVNRGVYRRRIAPSTTTQYGGIGKPYWWVLNVRRRPPRYGRSTSTTDPRIAVERHRQ